MTKFLVRELVSIKRGKLLVVVDDEYNPIPNANVAWNARDERPVTVLVRAVPNPSQDRTKGMYHVQYHGQLFGVSYRVKMKVCESVAPKQKKPIRCPCDAIFIPSVQSTGDIYHVLVLLILCRENIFAGDVPTVFLGYDTDDTKKSAERSAQLLRELGFTGNVINVPTKAYHATVRLAAARSQLCSKNQAYLNSKERVVSQKMTTSLFSYAVRQFGREHVCGKIFSYVEKIGRGNKAKPALDWGNEQTQAAIKHLDLMENKFVVVSIRVSTKANANQNFTEDLLKVIYAHLEQLGVQTVLLDLGGNLGAKFAEGHKAFAIDCFPNIGGKLPHMFLLQAFSRLDNFQGVIGTTSGLLDIAAFMGLHTLCVHQFKDDGQNVCNQDLRVLLQGPFMSIFGKGGEDRCFTNYLNEWLKGKILLPCAKVTLEGPKPDMKRVDRREFSDTTDEERVNSEFLDQFCAIYMNQQIQHDEEDIHALEAQDMDPAVVDVSKSSFKDDLGLVAQTA